MYKVLITATVLTCEVLLGPTIAREATQWEKDADTAVVVHPDSPDTVRRALIGRELVLERVVINANPSLAGDEASRGARYQQAVNRGQAQYNQEHWKDSRSELVARVTAATTINATGAAAAAGAIGASGGAALPIAIGVAAGAGGGGILVDYLITRTTELADRFREKSLRGALEPGGVAAYNYILNRELLKIPEIKALEDSINIGVYKKPGDDPQVKFVNVLESINNDEAKIALLNSKMKLSDGRLNTIIALTMSSNKALKSEMDAAKGQFTDAVAEVVTQMNADLKRFNDFADRDQSQRDLNLRRDNITGAFANAARLAAVTGDNKSAFYFDKVSVASGAIFDLSTMAGGFSAQPFKYVNIYVALASTALELFKGAQEDPQYAGIMKGIKQLSEQIESMRKQMLERFDRLELQQAHYFYETFLDLNRIEASQISVAKAIDSLHADLDDLRANVSKQFNSMAQNQMLDLNTKCLAVGANGPIKIDSEIVAGECFSKYLALATGNLNSVLRSEDSEENQARFERLVATTSRYSRQSTSSPYDRNQFISGTLKFAQVMTRNPQWSEMGRTGHWDDEERSYSLSNLITQGNQMKAFQESMALESRPGGYVLRRDLIESLLQNYLSHAQKVSDIAASVYPAPLREWPDPGSKWENGGPSAPIETSFPFVHETVPLCDAPPAHVDLKNRTDRGRAFDGDDARTHGTITNYDQKLMGLNGDFLSFLPYSLRWADYLNKKAFRSFRLTACMNRADINELKIYRPNRKWNDGEPGVVDVTYGMNINVDYELGDGTKRKMLVSHIDGSRSDQTEFFDIGLGAGIMAMTWAGVAGDNTHGEYPRIFKNANGSFGMSNSPKSNFKETITPEIYNNRNLFEQDFNAIIDARKPAVFEEAARATRAELRELDSIRWQILYLIRHGLDLRHEGAAALYDRLRTKNLMTGDAYLHWAVDLSPARAIQKLREDIDDLVFELKELEKATDLSPPESPLTSTIAILEAFSSAGPPLREPVRSLDLEK